MTISCVASVLTGEKRAIPLDYNSAANAGWQSGFAAVALTSDKIFSADISANIMVDGRQIAILDAADIRDTGSRNPGDLRVAYYRPTHTEAHFNNQNSTGTLMLLSPGVQHC